jgi:hypothetical protein
MSRYHPATTPVSTYFMEYRCRLKKNGRPGKLIDAEPVYFCPLYDCQACLKRGGGRHIQYRAMLDKHLCMGCWNRLRVIERAQKAVDELGYLQRKLLRTRYVNQHG